MKKLIQVFGDALTSLVTSRGKKNKKGKVVLKLIEILKEYALTEKLSAKDLLELAYEASTKKEDKEVIKELLNPNK